MEPPTATGESDNNTSFDVAEVVEKFALHLLDKLEGASKAKVQ